MTGLDMSTVGAWHASCIPWTTPAQEAELMQPHASHRALWPALPRVLSLDDARIHVVNQECSRIALTQNGLR